MRAGGVEPPSLIADGLQPFELADAQHPQNSFLFICFAFSAAEFVFLFEPAVFLFQSILRLAFFISLRPSFLFRLAFFNSTRPSFYFICFDVSVRFLFQRFINFFFGPLEQKPNEKPCFKAWIHVFRCTLKCIGRLSGGIE